MKFEQACANMISQQLRTNQITEPRLLDLISAGRRQDFVPPQFRELAYADVMLDLGDGQVMMTPTDEGRMLNVLSPTLNDRVLEVGTGSGYVTSLLARLSQDVITIDNRKSFVEHAEKNLHLHNIHNVHFIHGDIFQTTFTEAFDVIAVTGSVPSIPAIFKEWLSVGGRLYLTVGHAPKMEAMCLTRLSAEEWQYKFLCETNLKPLDNFPHSVGFRF